MSSSSPLKTALKRDLKLAVGLRFRRELEANLRMTREEFDRYQTRAFRRMYEHAVARVPYYRDRRDVYRPEYAAIEPAAEAIRRLPILTKDVLREHNDAFFAAPPSRFATTHTTSGTTGTPIRIRGDVWERGFHEQLALRQGYVLCGKWMPRTVRITSMVPRGYQGGRAISFHDRVLGVLYLSMYELSPSRAEEYLDTIERFCPEVVFGYGSTLYAAAKVLGGHLRVPRIKGVISTAETMREDWLETIQEVFRCKLHEQYGSQESQFLVTECAAGSMHVNPEPGIVEIVDDDSRPVPDGGEGRVLVTGIARLSMPLMRFDLNDIAGSTGFRTGCACGCQWPTIGPVVGRIDDLVVTPGGHRLTAMNWHATKDVANIVKSQLIQWALKRFEMKVVAGLGYERAAAEATIRRVIHEYVGSDAEVVFEYVEEIPMQGRKYRAVVSHVRLPDVGRD